MGDFDPVAMAERNEALRADLANALADAAMWKANHDNQVAVKRALAVRADLPAHDGVRQLLAAETLRADEAVRERDEIQAVFDRMYAANIRGIEAWQAKHPGNDLVWPDHAKLVEWLLDQLSEAKKP